MAGGAIQFTVGLTMTHGVSFQSVFLGKAACHGDPHFIVGFRLWGLA
jgi:hypothetical protein